MTRLLDSSMVLVYGGEDSDGGLLGDMYCLNIDTRVWRKVTYADGPHPSPRILHTATAISSSAMVVMFGDGSVPAPRNDVWYFDVRSSQWMEIDRDDNTPPPRSCHSAVFGNGLGQVPAIYVFGGFGSNERPGNAVHRLKIGDWKWERLAIVVTDSNGKEVVMGEGRDQDPYEPSDEETEEARERQYPCTRESHGAIWLPAMNGMLIIGGDGGFSVLDDVWLLEPSVEHSGAWRWRHMKLKMARGFLENKLPPCAGFTLISLPTEKTQVMLWGGIAGDKGLNVVAPEHSYLLDFDAMQTTRLASEGDIPKIGRLLHGFVRAGNLVFTFAGCDGEGEIIDGLKCAKVRDDLRSVGLRAMDFGPVAAEVAAGMEPSLPEDEVEEGDSGDDDAEQGEESVSPIRTSAIPRGTALSGRIVEETDYGFFVSVVIKGKLYKGVLVANPLKNGEPKMEPQKSTDHVAAGGKGTSINIVDTTVVDEGVSEAVDAGDAVVTNANRAVVAGERRTVNLQAKGGAGTVARSATAAGEKVPGVHDVSMADVGATGSSDAKPCEVKPEEESAPGTPEPKRARLDPAVEALPDSPPLPRKVNETEIIDLA